MFFEGIAHAMGAPPQGGEQPNPLATFAPMILIFVIIYFLMIRPQQKKAKEHREFLANLKKGSYVLTSGGLRGRIISVEESYIELELGENNVVEVNRNFISGPADSPRKSKKNKND